MADVVRIRVDAERCTVERVGCCDSCSGTGGSGDPVTGGRCWDCYGTGHAHSGPCDVPAETSEEEEGSA